MGFFRRFRRNTEKDMVKLLTGPATVMADEVERVYTNQIARIVNDFPKSARLTAMGIYKARLFAVSFMVVAFARAWPKSGAISDMANAASGLAILPLVEGERDVAIDQNEAQESGGHFLQSMLEAIEDEVQNGPTQPELDNATDGFQRISDLYIDALSDSIFDQSKLEEEAIQPILHSMISTIFSSLSEQEKWAKKLS